MNFQQLVMNPDSLEHHIWILETVKNKPKLVKDLDRKAATKLLRYALVGRNSAFRKDVIKLIVKYKVDVNPLELALTLGNLRKTKFLLKNGARLVGPDWNGFLPTECIFLNRKVDVRKDLFQLILKYGFDPTSKNDQNDNSLHLLTENVEKDDIRALEIAEILVKAGVPVNEAGGHNSFTPLHNSIRRKNPKLAKFFIESGADVHQRDKFERTPLIIAACFGSEEIVRLLLAQNVDVNAKDCDGQTALHSACFSNCKRIIKLLMKKGADLCVEDENGKTPFLSLYAQACGYNACVSLMLKEFSVLSFENSNLVSVKDMNSIRKNSKLLTYFEKCTSEVKKMANTKFYCQFTYYSLLKMDIGEKRLALLTKNEELLEEFEENLSSFPNYQNELREIMNEAIQVRNNLEATESRLRYIFGDSLPDVVIRKLADHLTLEDLLEADKVSRSRHSESKILFPKIRFSDLFSKNFFKFTNRFQNAKEILF